MARSAAHGDASRGEPETRTAGRARPFISRLTSAVGLDLLVGALVISVYVVAQLSLLQGPHSYDPAKYFRNGVDFPAVGADYWTLRVGLMVPIRTAVAVFGPSEAALYAVPILSGALLAAAVYATMLLLFGKRVVAAAAALVTVLNPGYLLNSSHIFPDVTATTTFSLGFLCLVLAADDGDWLAGARSRAAAAGVAGFLFGWTYLTREFSPLLLPTVAAAVVLLRYPVRRVVVLASAALGTFSLELLYGLLRYGDAFIRTKELLARSDARIAPHRTQRMDHIQGQLGDLGETILVLPRLLLAWETGWTLVVLIGGFALALVLVRDRRLWLLAVWFLWYWAALAVIGLLSQTSGGWLLNITNVRYWYLLFPPLVMAHSVGSSCSPGDTRPERPPRSWPGLSQSSSPDPYLCPGSPSTAGARASTFGGASRPRGFTNSGRGSPRRPRRATTSFAPIRGRTVSCRRTLGRPSETSCGTATFGGCSPYLWTSSPPRMPGAPSSSFTMRAPSRRITGGGSALFGIGRVYS